MKITLDLPEDSIRRLKLRAVHDGRKLKDVAAEVVRAGLDASRTSATSKPVVISKDKETGIPVIVGPKVGRSGKSLTPEQMAQVLVDQEAEWAIDASRH
jgi:hypothetical protein